MKSKHNSCNSCKSKLMIFIYPCSIKLAPNHHDWFRSRLSILHELDSQISDKLACRQPNTHKENHVHSHRQRCFHLPPLQVQKLTTNMFTLRKYILLQPILTLVRLCYFKTTQVQVKAINETELILKSRKTGLLD